jgi:hypothetical protein
MFLATNEHESAPLAVLIQSAFPYLQLQSALRRWGAEYAPHHCRV